VLTAEQQRIFIRLEITQAHNHFLRRKCRRDHADAFRHARHEIATPIAVAGNRLVDVTLLLLAQALILKEGARVHLDAAADDELEARAPTPSFGRNE
jgi:hypothetical protein